MEHLPSLHRLISDTRGLFIMGRLVKVLVVVFFLYQCDRAISKKYIKFLSFEKEDEHGVVLHHLRPISIIKETITPFGKFSFRHLIEKRDLHKRKRRDLDDALNVPVVNIEEGSKAIEEVSEKKIVPTDIILARVEFYKAKPIETISLHSILPSLNAKQEFKFEDIISPEVSETISESEGKDIKDSIPEPVPLSIPVEDEKVENADEHIEHKENESVEDKPVVSETEEHFNGELDEKPEPVLEATDLNEEKENQETELLEPEVEKESIKEEHVEVAPDSVIENRDVEVDNIQSNNVIENVESVSSDKLEPSVEAAPPSENAVEIAALPVSPLPIPVYIPLYTEIKAPIPIPAPVPTEAPVVVKEVVNIIPPVVVVTEKAAEVPPPPPPPVETVTTVVESESTPSLFTRGSRFMLNISSRILKKMLRLVAMARTRLHLGGAVEE